MNARLEQAASRLENWLKNESLPLWAKVGIDEKTGAHVERLGTNGLPDPSCNIRVRVQARQVFVYSFAYHLGWFDQGKDLAEGVMHFIEHNTRHPDAGEGYTHLMNPQYEVIDQKQDIYDHAFFILANCWYYRAFQSQEALARVDAIVAHLDSAFGSDAGGWIEGDYDAPCRRQNPHMHLFEAFLALYEGTKDPKYLARADHLFGLFENKFFDPEHHVLLEYFDADWTVVGGDKGDIIEPGHMMEWVWLLRWYGQLSGKDVAQYADAMYEKASAIGYSEASGLMYDEVSPAGEVSIGTKRCWPMTEVIKANIAQARAGHKECEERAAEAIDKLFEYYLCSDIPGAYCDQRGAEDEVVMPMSPASTLYHLVVAAAEVSAYCKAEA